MRESFRPWRPGLLSISFLVFQSLIRRKAARDVRKVGLNVIIGFAGLLVESDRLDARQRRYATHIAASGARACAILRAFFREHRAGSRTGIVLNEASSSPGAASPTRTSDGK